MTETTIQDALLTHVTTPSDLAALPNCGAYGYEADLLRITRHWRVFEYEIKTSRADFRADANKQHRKLLTTELTRGSLTPGTEQRWPNRIIYVAPANIIPHDEVPSWAGLIECNAQSNGTITFRKPAQSGQLLHRERASHATIAYLMRGLHARYWNLRKRNPTRSDATPPPLEAPHATR